MKTQLRIVHCFRSPVGGICRHVRDLARAQAANGHLVGVVCDSSTGGEFEKSMLDKMSGSLALGAHRTPMQRHVGAGDLVAAWRTYRIINELRPDVLHGHGAKGGVYSRFFGSLLRVSRSRVARLYSPHGGSLHYDQRTPRGKMFFAAERMMDRFTDHLLFVSEHEHRAFRQKIGEPRAPHSVVYNGLGACEFEPVPSAPDSADFLYIGMMRDLKGPDVFIDALAKAERHLGRALTAVMVGAGDDRSRYEAQAARLGFGQRVRFFDPMPARQAFALARTVVVPSRAEAMPYIVLEALGAGMPVLASAVGGIPEIFGWDSPALIKPANPEALAAQMANTAGNEAVLLAAMPSQDALKARFGADVMAQRIEAIYRNILAR